MIVFAEEILALLLLLCYYNEIKSKRLDFAVPRGEMVSFFPTYLTRITKLQQKNGIVMCCAVLCCGTWQVHNRILMFMRP